MEICVLYLGYIACKKMFLVDTPDARQDIRSPISALLIRHPTLGNVLYDTGNSPFFATEYSPATLQTYPIPEFISIEEALRAQGLTPGDIDWIILSHLHFDHAGGLRYFRGTKAIRRVLASEAEIKNAYFQTVTGAGGAYCKELFDFAGIQFCPVTQDTELAPDLKLFVQHAHTPGVLGLVLRTQTKGTVICTSDSVYTAESYARRLPPGGHINKSREEFFENLEKLEAMKKACQATLFYGHDYEQVLRWSRAGSFT